VKTLIEFAVIVLYYYIIKTLSIFYACTRPDWQVEGYVAQPVRSCECDISKTNEPISMPIGTSFPQGKGLNRSTLGIRGSKVKVTHGR